MQVDGKGVMTAMAANGIVVASWLGTNSFWDLAGPLTALDERCRALGEAVFAIYVDNTNNTEKVLKLIFKDLGRGFFKDEHSNDGGMRLDEYHCSCLVKETCRGNHPLMYDALDQFRDLLNIVHPDDVGQKFPRKFKPPPHVLVPKFLRWIEYWSANGVDHSTGQHIFSVDSYLLFGRILRFMSRCGAVP
jgi:hypothetical protein